MPHGECPQHQVAARDPFECSKIRVASLRRSLETGQGLFKPFPGVALPVMPAVPDEIVGLRHIQPIAQFGVIADPSPEFPQRFLHLSDGHGYRVTRDGNSMPRLTDHLRVVHTTTAALNQYPQRMQRLRSQLKFNPIPKQARSFGIKAERSERNLADRGPHGYSLPLNLTLF